MSAELAIIAKLQDEASSGIRALRGEVEGLEPSAGIAAKGFASLQAVGAAALAALAAAAVAVGGAIASSISVAADFESQIAILSTAAGGAGTSLDSLRDAAMAVGADVSLVGVSASGAADAMTILYKAGLSTGEIFGDLNGYLSGNVELSGALRAAIDGAAASELDMAQAAELAATTLATFGGSMTTAEERAQFVNVALNNFVQTADASVASVADLAAAMQTIGPTAAQFGFSLQDTNTALALLSTRGIAGSEAGTALKSMFVNLMRPTEDVKGALNELGVSLYNADGTMRSMPSIIGDLSQALYGMNEVTSIVGGRTAEQNHQLDLAKKSYDQATDAIYKHNAGLKVLTDSNLQKYVDQQAAANAEIQRLSAVTGTASTAVSQLTEEQRNQYIQTLAGSYGMKAMAVLLMEGTAGWEAMEKAISEAATIQEVAAARTQTFSGAMEALGGVIETIQIGIGSAFLPVLTALAKAFAELASQNMKAIVDAFEALGGALTLFFDAILNGTHPVTAFADAVGHLAEALGMPAEQAALLREQIEGVLMAVSSIVGPIVQAITSFVSWKDVLVALGIAIASVVIPLLIGLVQVFAPIIATIAAVILAVAALRNAWEADFLGIRSAVEGAVEIFGRFVEAIRVFTDTGASIQQMLDS
jgi:TP901 family phage tail tape measure protein